MSLFRGHARQGRYDPINIPNPVPKIEAESRARHAKVRRANNSNKQQNARLVQAMDENFQVEQRTREADFKAKQSYAEIVAKQKWKNYDILIKNKQAEERRQKENIQALIGLTKTGLNLYTKHVADQKKAAQNWAYDLEEEGFSLDDYNTVQNLREVEYQQALQTEGQLTSFGLNSAMTPEVLKELRKANKWQITALQDSNARNLMMEEDSYITNNKDKLFEISGNKVSLDSANDWAIREEVTRRLRQDFRAPFLEKGTWPSAATLHGSGAIKIREQNDQYRNKRYKQRDLDASTKSNKESNLTLLLKEIHTKEPNGGPIAAEKGLIKYAYFLAGHTKEKPASKRNYNKGFQQMADDVISLFESDRINPYLINLDNLELESKQAKDRYGKPNKLSFQNEWRGLYTKMSLAQRKAMERHDIAQQNQLKAHKEKGKQALITFRAKVEAGIDDPSKFVSPSEMTATAMSFKKNSWMDEYNEVVGIISTSGSDISNDALQLANYTRRTNENEYIDIREIDNLRISGNAKVTIKKLINDNNKFLPPANGHADDLTAELGANNPGRITKFLAWVVKKHDVLLSPDSHSDALKAAEKEAWGIYKDHMITASATTNDPVKQATIAYDKTVQEMEKIIKDPEGDYRLVTSASGTPEHWISRANKDLDVSVINTEELVKAIKANPNHLRTNKVFSYDALADMVYKTNATGRLPTNPLLDAIAKNSPTVSYLDVLKDQIEYNNNKVKEKGVGTLIPEISSETETKIRLTEDVIDQEYKGWLCTLDKDFCHVNRAAIGSNQYMVYTEPEFNKAQKNASLPTGGDPNAVGTAAALGTTFQSSTPFLGYALNEMTVREVINLTNKGHYVEDVGEWLPILNVGKYGFTMDNLIDAIRGNSLDIKFNEDTQDFLFRKLLKDGKYTALPGADAASLEVSYNNITKPITTGFRTFPNEELTLHPQFIAAVTGGIA